MNLLRKELQINNFGHKIFFEYHLEPCYAPFWRNLEEYQREASGQQAFHSDNQQEFAGDEVDQIFFQSSIQMYRSLDKSACLRDPRESG